MLPALDFSINQGEKTNLIYIKPSENAEELIASLVVTNSTDDQSIQFKGHSGTASRSNYHFKLRFKHGHLDNPAQIKLQTNSWSCHYQQYRQYDYIYFLATSSVSLHDDTTLQLQNLFASGVPGTTDVSLLWYDNPNYVAISGGNDSYDTQTDHTVNIANYTQQVYVPLHVGFVGSNTVLNDGTTENTLTLRLTNISNKPLALVNGPKKATFTLHFDYDPANNQDKEWALLDQNTANAIEMAVKHNHDSWVEVSKNSEGTQPLWSFTVPHNAQPLASYDFIDVTITGIKTAYPTGQTNLYLHTTNTPGHWDGYYTAVIEKSPLIYSGARVGIGTARPQGTLDVQGSVYISEELVVGLSQNNGRAIIWGKLNTSDEAGLKSLYVQEKTKLYGALEVHENTTLSGTLTVGSATTLNQLTVDGNSTLSGQLTVGSATTLQQLTVNGNTMLSNGLTVDGNSRLSGILGIGTTSTYEEANLTVQSTKPKVALLLRSADGSSGSTYYDAAKIEAGWETDETAWNQAFIKFHTHRNNHSDFSPTATATLTVKGANVGIGTNTPQATLDVHGNLNVSGSLTVGSITLTEENLKFLKGLADGTAVVNFMTRKNYVIDNYGTRADHGDADRTIQFKSGVVHEGINPPSVSVIIYTYMRLLINNLLFVTINRKYTYS